MPHRPRVLAVTRDAAYLRALRVDMPLFSLKKQGFIADYRVTNPTLFDVPDDYPIDVIWLQRVSSRELIRHLNEVVNGHYLYDLDDLLVSPVQYKGCELIDKQAALSAVKSCRVLTVTSQRLGLLLQKYAGASINTKTFICPNAFHFSGRLRQPQPPQGILITSNDESSFQVLEDTVMDVVTEFAAQRHLPVYYFGPAKEFVQSKCTSAISFGFLPFWHYHAILASLPPMLGIAPLQTQGSGELLEFVNGKSDIKMVDYAGFGHPAVYTDAPPYSDSDLQAGVLVGNTPDAWANGLHHAYQAGWKTLETDQERVVELRHADRIASQCWLPALLEARLPVPIPAKGLKLGTGRLRFFLDAAKHMVYSQDHAYRQTLKEHLPPFLLRLARALFGR